MKCSPACASCARPPRTAPEPRTRTKKPSGPGESKQNHKDGGSRVDPPQQSGTPILRSITWRHRFHIHRPAHSGGSAKESGKEHSMDCVNHSGVTATAFCQNCGKALCAKLRAQRRGGTDPLRTVLGGMAERSQSIHRAAAGRTQSLRRRGAGTDSRRGRHVQRAVFQGPDPRGDLRGHHQHHHPLRALRAVHPGLDPVPVV